MSRAVVMSMPPTSEMMGSIKNSSPQDLRRFLERNPEQVFGVRDATNCPLAKYFSEVVGEDMYYKTPAPGIIVTEGIDWTPGIAIAVDQEPTDTITAKRVLSLMDELGIVESAKR